MGRKHLKLFVDCEHAVSLLLEKRKINLRELRADLSGGEAFSYSQLAFCAGHVVCIL